MANDLNLEASVMLGKAISRQGALNSDNALGEGPFLKPWCKGSGRRAPVLITVTISELHGLKLPSCLAPSTTHGSSAS